MESGPTASSALVMPTRLVAAAEAAAEAAVLAAAPATFRCGAITTRSYRRSVRAGEGEVLRSPRWPRRSCGGSRGASTRSYQQWRNRRDYRGDLCPCGVGRGPTSCLSSPRALRVLTFPTAPARARCLLPLPPARLLAAGFQAAPLAVRAARCWLRLPLRTAAGLRAYNGSTRFLRAAALGRLSAGWRTWPRASSSRIPTRPRAPHAGCSCCAPRATPSGLTTCIRSTPSSGELVSARCAAPARTCCLSTGLWRSDGYAEVPGTGLVAIAVRCANALGRPRRDCIASHARPGSRPVPCRGPDDFVLTG